ncbi:MAG TPA: hypothetical protein VHV30_16530 [Polyangiaceae bacterium]|jgi:hypothetical protein|nr:hypothetical protein [Polyangiaceae bacterium]
MKRFGNGEVVGAPSRDPGPVFELDVHLALLPMLRAGVYVAHDIEPLSYGPAREFTEAGLRAKLTPPLIGGPWQTWVFAGAGYARVYEPSHALYPSEFAGASGPVLVDGEGGGLLELRLGLGIGVRLGRGWEPFVELGGRGALAAGSLYDREFCTSSGTGICGGEPYAGKDSFALSLSVGLSLNQ